MNRLLTILAIVLLFPLQGMSEGYKQQWRRATDSYMQKQYDSAAYYFEQVAATKPQNAEVYYNLGNTYYRLNRIALAVLNYERALRIDPSNKDAQDNLAITQARITHQVPHSEEIFFMEWWKNTTSHTKATGWAIAALITFVLIIACIWSRRFGKIGSRIPVQVPGILGFVCVVFLVFAFVAAGRSVNSSGAVVMENDAALMNNEQKGKPTALLPEGVTVQIISERGMWVEISLPDGRTGWVQQAQISKI